MRIFILLLFFVGNVYHLNAQRVNILAEPIQNGFEIFASNNEFSPVSIILDLDLTNMIFSEGEKKVFIIPSQVQKFKIGQLKQNTPKAPYKFSYKFNFTLGDVTKNNFDTSTL